MMALLDVTGVVSILPFIAVLTNPEIIETNSLLNFLYTELEFKDSLDFMWALGVLVFVLLISSLSFKALTTFVLLRFVLSCEYSIGKRLVAGYLNQPYVWFLGRKSTDLGKNILSEVGGVISNGVMPMINLVSQSILAISLLSLLIAFDSKLAITTGTTLLIVYIIIFKISRGFLQRIGNERLKANQERFSVVNEAFTASKEVKVFGLEMIYLKRFSVPA